MNIAYLSTFYPFRGGIAQFNASLYRELIRQGHATEAVTFSRQYPDMLFPGSSQYVTDQDKADPVPAKRMLDSVQPFSWGSTRRYLRALKPELVLTKFWMPFFGPSLGYALRGLPVSTKRISILDNVIPHERRFFDMPFLRYFLDSNDGFVVMSEAVKKDLLSLKAEAKFIFHPHPLYDHFGDAVAPEIARKKLRLPEGRKLILFFGFIRGYKGLDVLIRAMKQLPEDHVLVIAGEVYGSFDEYNALIADLGIQHRVVKMVRYIPDHEVPLFFCGTDVCVLPYKSATQSGIVPIAYHFNRPVLATDVGGLKEMMVPGKTGLMIPKAEPQDVAQTIETYFNHQLETVFVPEIIQFKKAWSWESLAHAITDFSTSLSAVK